MSSEQDPNQLVRILWVKLILAMIVGLFGLLLVGMFFITLIVNT